MNRVLFFYHCNDNEELPEYADYLLQHIKYIYKEVIVIPKNNLRETLLGVDLKHLSGFDNITLMSGGCFGPISNLETLYLKMENDKADFWNLHGRITKKEAYREHDMLCLSNKVVVSKEFIKLLKKLTVKGAVSTGNVQPDLEAPLLTIRSFYNFIYPKYLLENIQQKSGYPADLIKDYFRSVYGPDFSILIEEKKIAANEDTCNLSGVLKIAIHIHIHYLDVFESYAEILDKMKLHFDLFLTTNTIEKKSAIEEYLKGHAVGERVKEIVITENKGRDILPWLKIAGKINSYDVACHFHTKKSRFVNEWIGKSWQHDMLNLLVKPMYTIIKTFEENKEIGIIIPDIPSIYNCRTYTTYFRTLGEIQDKKIMNTLWKRMGCKKKINFDHYNSMVFAYGNMFWYRPAALKPLLGLELGSNDIPDEPVKNDGTILHAIERLPVYTAWNEGFDFRIMTNPNRASGIETSITVSQNLNLGSWRYFQALKLAVKKLIS
ncbi:alpha-L-Rha alpha-1,3-L-rhamnosyltransferase [Spirochaetia bacterium]|nr:alpha-L-Rha alpha-1,3-L-rhamnosyltransferase [Spirochaetia bacterium]